MRFLIAICIFCTTPASAEPFVINVVESYQGHIEQKALEISFTALYAPLGIVPKFVYYPSKRGLLLVNKGMIDAEAARFELASKDYPNLIKVDEPISFIHSGIYCLNSEMCQLSKIGNLVALASFQSAKKYCSSQNLTCSLEPNPTVIAKLLEKGVVMGFLSASVESNKVLCALKQDKLYYHNLADFARASYHFVNKRHVALVSKLEQTIRDLKRKNLVPRSDFDGKPRHLACGKKVIAV
jgi:hypothetical protein